MTRARGGGLRSKAGPPSTVPHFSAIASTRTGLSRSDAKLTTLEGGEARAGARMAHDSFRSLVTDPAFPCVGARSAVHRGNYRLGLYDTMASAAATVALARDLYTFVDEVPSFGDAYSTFAATFRAPVVDTELAFEELLWAQLARLHNLDHPRNPWVTDVSSDPDDPRFAFSFGQMAFFVVGLHPGSSRWARRSSLPTLVFNPHAQFDRLRADGHYERMQQVVRARDTELQGSHNPSLRDFGESSEARQYSGRMVEEDWVCPFHPHTDQ